MRAADAKLGFYTGDLGRMLELSTRLGSWQDAGVVYWARCPIHLPQSVRRRLAVRLSGGAGGRAVGHRRKVAAGTGGLLPTSLFPLSVGVRCLSQTLRGRFTVQPVE